MMRLYKITSSFCIDGSDCMLMGYSYYKYDIIKNFQNYFCFSSLEMNSPHFLIKSYDGKIRRFKGVSRQMSYKLKKIPILESSKNVQEAIFKIRFILE